MGCSTPGFPVFTVSWSFLKLTPIKSVIPSNHLVLCYPFLLLSSIFPSIRVFSSELALHIRWPNIGASASASVLSTNIQGWFPLGLTVLISLQSKGLSRVFSSTLSIYMHQLIPVSQTHLKHCISFLFLIMYLAFLFLLFIYLFLFICLFLTTVDLLALHGLRLVAASQGYSSLECLGFSIQWLLLFQNTGCRQWGFSSCGTRLSLSCLMTCGIFPDQWSNWCTLLWQAHS